MNERMVMGTWLVYGFLFLLVVAIPSVVAFARQHPHRWAIAVVNLIAPILCWLLAAYYVIWVPKSGAVSLSLLIYGSGMCGVVSFPVALVWALWRITSPVQDKPPAPVARPTQHT